MKVDSHDLGDIHNNQIRDKSQQGTIPQSAVAIDRYQQAQHLKILKPRNVHSG
jgi:hypothetical protein